MFERPDSSLDQHAPLVAHAFRVDVFVAGGARDSTACTCIPPLWAKALCADERLVGAEVHVGNFVDVTRQLGEPLRCRPESTW